MGQAAAAGLVLLVLTVVITHLRRKDPVALAGPAFVFFAASVAALALRLATV